MMPGLLRSYHVNAPVSGAPGGPPHTIGLLLIIISPIVWGGPPGAPDTGAFTWYDLNNPGIISIPLGFLGCYVGTLLSHEGKAERTFHELHVRSETGLGAEKALGYEAAAAPSAEKELVHH